MNLNEYTETLQEILEENPHYGELEVIAATDTEGNGFQAVDFHPTVGHLNKGEFTSAYPAEDADEGETNAICVN